jgi:hypothetical protein
MEGEMSLNEEVQRHIESAYLKPARARGETTIHVKAGDVHRDLHWVNRVPSVCTTLGSQKFQRETGLELVHKDGPPSGMGTRMVYTYCLVADKNNERSDRGKNLLEGLYGIAADVFHDLGGSDHFLRKEREQLRFIQPEEEKAHEAKKK